MIFLRSNFSHSMISQLSTATLTRGSSMLPRPLLASLATQTKPTETSSPTAKIICPAAQAPSLPSLMLGKSPLPTLNENSNKGIDKAVDANLIPGTSSFGHQSGKLQSFDLSRHFSTFLMLMEYVLDHSKSHGFIISQKPKLHFDKGNWLFDHPFKLVASRGWCLCSPKFQNRSSKSSCPYKIVYESIYTQC